eukprot:gene10387-12758_t
METITNNRKRFVIIDEAQIAYKKDYEPFWNRIKELLDLSNNRNVYIFLVATYVEDETRRITPIEFSSTNSLDLSSILLTKSEYTELIENFNNNPNNLSKICMPPKQREFLNQMILSLILYQFHTLTIYLKLGQYQKTPSILQREIIERVLTYKGAPLKNSLSGIDGIHFRLLEKYGVLVVMTLDNVFEKVYFASPIIKTIYFSKFFGSLPVEPNPMESIENFVQSALRFIDYRSFLENMSEDFWQKQFYIAAKSIIPITHSIHPSVGHDVYFKPLDFAKVKPNLEIQEQPQTTKRNTMATTKSTKEALGLMDFFINIDKDWGIEITREGDQLTEHLERFLPGGLYYHFNNKLKNYLVLDFRSKSRNIDIICPPTNVDHLWHISYSDNSDELISKNSKKKFHNHLNGDNNNNNREEEEEEDEDEPFKLMP